LDEERFLHPHLFDDFLNVLFAGVGPCDQISRISREDTDQSKTEEGNPDQSWNCDKNSFYNINPNLHGLTPVASVVKAEEILKTLKGRRGGGSPDETGFP
jgi:hypothetical protein